MSVSPGIPLPSVSLNMNFHPNEAGHALIAEVVSSKTNIYDITFRYNDGKTENTTEITYTNGQLTTLPTPTRKGYTFAGWYTADGVKVTESFQFTEDTVLYARWSTYVIPVPYAYVLTFETNGGSYVDEIVRFTGMQLNLRKFVPEKEGYIFTGWYTDPELTKEIKNLRLVKDTTVYAGWEAIEPEGEPDTATE